VFCFPHLSDEAAFTEEADRSVDGRPGSLCPRFPYLDIEGFGIEMTVSGHGFFQDGRPLFGEPLTAFFQESAE
jgi:hypothetical protein